MNISMQVRRAFITLGLAATALVFIAAKTSMGAPALAQIPSDESTHAEAVSVVGTTLNSSPVSVAARVVAPMIATKERTVRKMARLRCESVSRG